MSWLVVTLDFPPAFTGGIASWAADLASALHAHGETVTVLAAGPPQPEADAQLPYPVIRAAGRSWARFGALWTALAGAPRVLGAREPLQVVFATWPIAALLGPLAARSGARVAVAFHGSDLTRLVQAPPSLLRVARSARALLPVSRFLAGELDRLAIPRPAHVLPMPVTLDQPTQPRGEALLCVARLTPLKGVERAARLAQALGRPLVVVGDGPEEARLRAKHPEARFLGRLPREAIAQIPACAAVLLPRAEADGSGAEGLGLVLIEAALRGLPTIGCPTGGVPEALGPGLLLADPEHPDAAALQAAGALLDDPEAGARARRWAQATHGPARTLTVLRAALADHALAESG